MSIDADIAGLQAISAQNSSSGGNSTSGAQVAAMQAAGNHAVTVIGPEIDALSGGNPQVTTITQLAWQGNGSLAGVDASDTATQDTVDVAAAMLNGMVTQYNQAYALAKSLAPATTAAKKSAAPIAPYRPPSGMPTPLPTAPIAPGGFPTPPAAPGSFSAWLKANQGMAITGGILGLGLILTLILVPVISAKGVAALAAA
jgi:hypothetical protein